MNKPQTGVPVVSIAPAMLRNAAIVLGGSLVLAAAAQIQIPAFPVPITMQSLAVAGLAMTLGARLGVATVALYLLEGAMGLPVFAGFKAGIPHLFGATGGYLIGFLVMAWLAGALADRGWTKGLVKPFANALLSHVVLLVIGTAYLGAFIGMEPAFWAGFAPFIIGSLLKAGLLAGLINVTDGVRKCLPILR